MTREIRDGLAARIALSKELVEFDPFMPSGQALLFAKFILERDKSRDQAITEAKKFMCHLSKCDASSGADCTCGYDNAIKSLDSLSDKKGGA